MADKDQKRQHVGHEDCMDLQTAPLGEEFEGQQVFSDGAALSEATLSFRSKDEER